MEARKSRPYLKDLTGKRFTRLTVIKESSRSGRRAWICRCDCGEVRTVITNGLNNGSSKSCGCLSTEILLSKITTHKMTNTKPYRIWGSMKQRCLNPDDTRYHDYGGRGIKVCDEWLKFENFYKDMGEPPKGKSLDRKDNDKGYNRDNCRWATASEQQRNSRNNIVITYKGETKPLIDWAEQLGIEYGCLVARIKRGWTIERAMSPEHMSACIDLTGKSFGNLKVIERAENNKQGSSQWLCICSCGKTKIISIGNLKSRQAKLCKCRIVKEESEEN